MTRHRFVLSSPPSECDESAVLIVGLQPNLALLKFEMLEKKLSGKVSAEIFQRGMQAVAKLGLLGSDTISLSMNVVLSCLPGACSRHNSVAQPLGITKAVKSFTHQTEARGVYSVVLVVTKEHALASVCAVARAYPLYSRRTSGTKSDTTVHLDLLVVENTTDGLTVSSLPPNELDVLSAAMRGVQEASKIVDTPCLEMDVDTFIAEADELCSTLKIKKLAIRGADLREGNFGGLYHVGKAAQCPPGLLVLSHEAEGATKTIALVGKGIVYDTGGLSLKTRQLMAGMKRDCGGAAALLGAFYALVKSGFQQNLHAVLCLAENAIGPGALRVDDIITLYSGKTVEVNNPDAEGRLVLGDGVSYADRVLKADIIIDMATLTGAQGTCTGKYHGAVLTNNEQWEQWAVQAGRTSGDLLHPLPYCPELHFGEFSSVLADMKNSVADRSNAQPSCAGLFIGAHLGFNYPGAWIHVDMASPVSCGDRATGYGVALIMCLLGAYTNSQLLQLCAPALS